MDCPFCSIVKGDIPAHTIYEDEQTLAFLDINPSAPGHTLVIPKEHYPNILEAPEDSLAAVFRGVQKATRMLAKALKTDHFTTGYNMGSLSGQDVFHMHVHIKPRFEGDGGRGMEGVVHNPPEESLEEIKDKILKTNG